MSWQLVGILMMVSGLSMWIGAGIGYYNATRKKKSL